MKPLVRDMVRVGVSVSVVTGLVLLPLYPFYVLHAFNDCCNEADQEPAYDLSIVSLNEGLNSVGIAINDRGEVVGTAFDNDHKVRAFVRRGSETRLLPVPHDAPLSVATNINENGVIVGNAGTDETVRGVLWRGAKIELLTAARKDTMATTVSKDGTAAGISLIPNTTDWMLLKSFRLNTWRLASQEIYLWNSGVWCMEASPSAPAFSGMLWKRSGDGKGIGNFSPQATNAQGVLVGLSLQKGQRAPAFFKAGKIALLPQPKEAVVTVPMSITADETVVGATVLADDKQDRTTYPVRWVKGRMEFLPVPGNRQGIALGISNQKTVVGVIEAEDGMGHAAIWKDGEVTDLNNLVDDKAGWTLVQARGINNNDQIVGTAIKGERMATFVIGCPKSDK